MSDAYVCDMCGCTTRGQVVRCCSAGAKLALLRDALAAEKDKVEELELTFDLTQSAYERGTAAWQEATGKTMATPDTGDLVRFLLEKVEGLECKLQHHETFGEWIDFTDLGCLIPLQSQAFDALLINTKEMEPHEAAIYGHRLATESTERQVKRLMRNRDSTDSKQKTWCDKWWGWFHDEKEGKNLAEAKVARLVDEMKEIKLRVDRHEPGASIIADTVRGICELAIEEATNG